MLKRKNLIKSLLCLEKCDIELLGELIGLDRGEFSAAHWQNREVALSLYKYAENQKLLNQLENEIKKSYSVIWDDINSKNSSLKFVGHPYPGLKPFSPNDRDRFFGRELESQELLNKIAGNLEFYEKDQTGQPFVIVVGASGSGKSSLVGAGLIPLLKGDPRTEHWIWTRMVPLEGGQDPLESLSGVFANVLGLGGSGYAKNKQNILQSFKINSGLRDTIEGNLPPQKIILLWIDQFEELFTNVEESTRQNFLQLIVNGLIGNKLKIIATLRAEFYHRCLEERDTLLPYLETGHYPLFMPNETSLASIIEGPANYVGLNVQAELLACLITDSGGEPGNLPLLAFALVDIYNKYSSSERSDNYLRIEDYEGLKNILGTRAEEMFSNLSDEAQSAFNFVFSNLVEQAADRPPTRRRAFKEIIRSSHSGVDSLINTLIEGRLLVSDISKENQATLEVAHEALFLHWPRLCKWIASNQEYLTARSRISSAAINWHEKGEPKDFLLSAGKPIVEAEEILVKGRQDFSISKLTTKYISASIHFVRQKQRKKVFIAIVLSSIFFLVVSGLGFFSYYQWKNAEKQALFAEIKRNEAVKAKGIAEKKTEIAKDAERQAVEAKNEMQKSNIQLTNFTELIIAIMSRSNDSFEAFTEIALQKKNRDALLAVLDPLIEKTESMNAKEREYWRTLLPNMNDEQVSKLLRILANELYQLASLDRIYYKEIEKLNEEQVVELELERKKLDISKPKTYTNLALELIKLGNPENNKEIVSLLEEVIKKDDKNDEAYYLFGNFYNMINDYSKSEEYLEKALHINDGVYKYQMLMGNVKYNNNKYFSAKKNFRKAIVIKRNENAKEEIYYEDIASALSMLGFCEQNIKEYEEAAIHLKEVVKLYEIYLPKNDKEKIWKKYLAYLNYSASFLGNAKKYPEAVIYAKKALEAQRIIGNRWRINDDGLSDIFGNLAWYQILSGYFKDALSSALEGLKLSPTKKFIETNLAHAYLFTEQYEKAKNIYVGNKGLELDNEKWEEVILNDFSIFENAGLMHPDMEKIKSLLRPSKVR